MGILEWESERNILLKEHLSRLGKIDLNRLKKCFEYEYTIHPENKADIDNILTYINQLLEK